LRQHPSGGSPADHLRGTLRLGYGQLCRQHRGVRTTDRLASGATAVAWDRSPVIASWDGATRSPRYPNRREACMTVVMAGCGDLGTEAALRFAAAGRRVIGLRRRPDVLPAPIEGRAVDLAHEV